MSYVVSFEQLRMTDVDSVGGKNASLGEMISQLAGAGVRVPGGFATTAQAFRDFLKSTRLDQRIADMVKAGAHPIAARCAISGSSTDSICLAHVAATRALTIYGGRP